MKPVRIKHYYKTERKLKRINKILFLLLIGELLFIIYKLLGY